MAQPSISSYFNTRKRHATDDVQLSKSKVPVESTVTTRSGRTIKRVGSTQLPPDLTNNSPKKKAVKEKDVSTNQTFAPKENKINQEQKPMEDLKGLVKKELTFEEVSKKVSRSAKLQQLKDSLNKIKALEETRKEQESRNRRLKEEPVAPKKNAIALKEFKTIEMEILVSPVKQFKTPTKILPPTPGKNELMSPKRTEVAKRLMFSPSKDGSPSKLIDAQPAYQKFLALSEKSSSSKLQLPFKYRCLIEVFRSLDQVCAMFFKRKECITFKKLKPAVQRMLRKNFHESHLAQVMAILPDAFKFTQTKMRNYGSASKQDYFQLIITPNVAGLPKGQQLTGIDEDNVLKSDECSAMSSMVMLERLQKFENVLLQRVHKEHTKFLKSLDPPIFLDPSKKVTRWHPEFDLENVPEIERGYIPQPPNVEKYSSAKDILSTARNLFNCATPMEKAMERLEAKQEEDKKVAKSENETPQVKAPETVETVLKGVPKSLLEKIRQKQAAKALDAMTRRPSQDREATKYSRLPEIARHLRNVFISEKKGVLTLEIVLKKIENSYRTSLTLSQIEEHLRLMSKECPEWIAFHEIRKTMYLKIVKDYDLKKVILKLEELANNKSK
ncbi:CDT1 family protein [Megaselia abdita]